MAVVDGLHASSRRGVVLGRGDLQLAVVWQRAYALDQALAICAGAYDGSPVVVLESPGDDLGCRGTAAVNHNYQWQLCIHRGRIGVILVLLRLQAALGAYHQRTLGDKEADYLYGFHQDAAAVAPEVIHQLLHSLFLELVDGFLHLLGNALGEAALIYVSGGVVEHSGVFQVRKMDALADNGYVLYLSCAEFLYLEQELGSGSAFHTVAALLGGESYYAYAVNLHNLVAADQAGLVGRGILIGLVDCDIAVNVRLIDNRAHSSVSPAEHHLKIFILLFRDINGIRIQGLEHRVNSGALYAVYWEGIYI